MTLWNRTTKPVTPTFKSEVVNKKTLVYKKPLSIEQEAQIYKATGKLPKYELEVEEAKPVAVPDVPKKEPELFPIKEQKPKKTKVTRYGDPSHGWTVKGIEIETRRAVEAAARKEGQKIGAWCNIKLREAAKLILTGKNLPVMQEALIDEVKEDIKTLKNDLPKMIKKALQESNRDRSVRKSQKGLFQRIFNK